MATKENAVVAKVIDSYTVVLNKGSADDVALGDRFLVYGIGAEIVDPETGESLGEVEIVRGTGKITHVQDKMSTLTSDKTFKGPNKTVKRVKSGTERSLIHIFGAQDTIETTEGVVNAIPFEGVKAKDKAKPI